MVVLLVIVLVALVAAFVLAPFRSAEGVDVVYTEDPVLAELEARKQAKYREIRDTELDHAQGKLTEPEFKRQEAELKAEAIDLLKRIDAASPAAEGSRAPGAPAD